MAADTSGPTLSEHHNYRRNTPNTPFRPTITPLCQDVRDTLMSRFSALARSFTSLRLLLSFTDPPSVAWAHLFQLPTAPRLLLCTSTVTKPRTLGGNESWAAHRAGTTDRPRTSGSLPRPSRRDPVCERWRFLNRGRDGRGRANARDNMAAPKNNRCPVKRLTRYSGQPGIPKINTATKSDKGSNRYSGQP